MKKLFLIALMAVTVSAVAKTITQKITVKGQCEMCKAKIEKALDIPGISFAEWNKTTKELTVRYNDKKVTSDQIHTIVSNLGYATDKKAANVAAQKALDKCCQPKPKAAGCCSGKKACSKKKS